MLLGITGTTHGSVVHERLDLNANIHSQPKKSIVMLLLY